MEFEFKKYTEIDNHYQNKVVSKVINSVENAEKCVYQITEKCDGCLDENTLIETKEFGMVPINYIVDNKIKCQVMSMNIETKTKEWDEIVNFSSEKNENKQWYEIELEDGSTIKITGNHKVWVPKKRKYISVDELDQNDEFLLKN